MPVPQQLFPEPAPTAASGNVAAGANAVADAAAAATANVNVNVNVNFKTLARRRRPKCKGRLRRARWSTSSLHHRVVRAPSLSRHGRCGQVKTAHLVRHATASQLSACEIGSAKRDEQKGE